MTEPPSINQYFVAQRVSPGLMDRIWAAGWRHFGTYFFRFSTMPHGEKWQTVIPLRVRLEHFQPSSSQRRVLKRNAALEVRIQPARLDAEKRQLFERHRVRFTENVPPSLETFLHPQPAQIPCETLELCLYRDGHLIGAHFLDVGETATSSVYSIYDPVESRHSLGVYLILLAIRYSLEVGKTLYYPGYATLESSVYDYKKNFAGLEGFDWRGHWSKLER